MKMLISSPLPECSGWTQGKWPFSHLSILSIFEKIFSPRDIWKVTEVIWKFETWKELFCKKCERAGVGLTVLATPSLPAHNKKSDRVFWTFDQGELGVKHDPCWPECVHIMCHSDCVWQITRPALHNNRSGRALAGRAGRGAARPGPGAQQNFAQSSQQLSGSRAHCDNTGDTGNT